jgi:polysaccharide biosynthesis transport protein
MELEQYLRIFGKYWWLILIIALIGGVSAIYFTSQQPLQYRSTATLLLSPALTREALLADPATVSGRLAQTYARYLKTRAFANIVIEQEGLEISADELVAAIDARVVDSTQFFEISATRDTPGEAQQLANVVSNYFIREILNQQREQERVRQAASNLDENQSALLQRLEQDRRYYEEEVSRLRQRVASLEMRTPSNGRDEELAEVRQRLSEQEGKLLQVMTNIVALRPTADSSQLNSVTLIERAVLPTAPLSNNLLRNAIFAFSAAALLGFCLAYGLEYLDSTIKSPEALEQIYGTPALGIIARFKGAEGAAGIEENILVLAYPHSSSAEAFRALRTNVQFSGVDRPIRSLVVTSAAPNEGKSTVSSNLAVVMAQAGKRVLLVDADLRRPTIHKIFGLSNTVGFTNLIIEKDPLNEDVLASYFQPGPVENLYVLTSGPIPPNPAELLSLERTQQMQENLLNWVDLVIYDTPPIVTVTDAAILASRADGTIQVIQAGRTRQALAYKVPQILEWVGATLLGPVLNGVEQKDLGYYYYYYHENHYSVGPQNTNKSGAANQNGGR